MKVGLILLLSSFLVALPGLVTACELRCASVPPVSHSQPIPISHCAGHAGENTSDFPSSAPAAGHHGCGGHALLIRGADPGGESGGRRVAPAPTTPISVSPQPVAGLTRLPEPASSPPLARSPSVLRL